MKYLLIYILIAFWLAAAGQEMDYASPVKIPLLLSGNFAELRSNHFHSGIDIKTQGKTGFPVHAVADGFISRIVVSPTGFGNALYIDHPNGTTSVYAHLLKFDTEIDRYVKNLHYKNKSHAIDELVPKNVFPVIKDAVIGQSGNSGSSGGPHLHFEIRDTKSEEPLNPLKYNFPVTDNIPPKIYSLLIAPLNEFGQVDYQAEKKTFPVVYENGAYHLKNNPIIPVYGLVGFGIQANDYLDGSNNRCGVYSVEMYFDGELFFSFKMDRFSFDETRYINSHIDHEEFITAKRRFHKAWLDPGNRLSIYDNVRNNGAVRVTDGNIHLVRFKLMDLNGNVSILDFNVESKSAKIQQKKSNYVQLLHYNKANKFSAENFRIEFLEETFYKDVKFTWDMINYSEDLYSNILVIHKDSEPLHKTALLSIKTGKIDKRFQEKVLLVNIDTITGVTSSAGGKYDDGWVSGNIRSFGNFAVAADTVAPKITPISIKDKSALTESSRIRFLITDDLSGIQTIEGTLDGKWILFEYDAKNDLITHVFDAERFELGKRHQFRLTVTDYKNNSNTYEASFWK